jgi:uncharacterized protein (DUF58 family)
MSDYSNAIRFALGTIAVYIAAITVGGHLLYYLAYVLAAVLVAAFVWSHLNKRGLRIRRTVFPSQAQVGNIIQETVEVTNLLHLPKLWVEIRDRSTLPGHRVGAVVSLPALQTKRWRVRTRCLARGLYHLGPTAIFTGDPFGLFRLGRIFDPAAELLVLPATIPLSRFCIPESELQGGTRTQRRAYHTTPNASGLRDYLPGDPMNRIHWPASARTQRLMVKEFELDPTADIWIVLDLHDQVHVEARDQGSGIRGPESITPGPLSLIPTTEEYSVTIAASVAAHLIAQGRSLGFIAWGQHRVVLPADRGGRQLIKILRALAVLRAEGPTPLGEILIAENRHFTRQDTLIVVTPSLDDEWLPSLQGQLRKGLHASAILVEPATFSPSSESKVLSAG